ncbi:uncharacterized protein CPUR_02495 [Claviceps purpurea 20.1]|uniref:Uncharacterized protein n=1 Tax=Claviceps purpurea (strain 20.1) TaxID=1111077 RepID=M1W044_CLAP2|nr:uncharacterized protein CPUR_02495 [Claviceps purpurea 20.1]
MKSMAFFRFAISCFLARWALVSALVVSEPTTGVFVPSWDVAIEPGQDNKIVVNGTIQQVDSYMEAHYPGWSAKMANFPSSHSAPAKRAPDWRKLKDFNCNRLLHRGSTRAIVDGINYLRSISKDRHPRNGPGPRSCGMVSCSWDAVIVWSPGAMISFRFVPIQLFRVNAGKKIRLTNLELGMPYRAMSPRPSTASPTLRPGPSSS